jgi:hypothetical protein
MRAFIAGATILFATLGVVAPASAFEGGGRKPSEAPLITVGQHYTGQLTNRKDDANFGAEVQVAIWRLPPLSVRDVIYVNWHSVPSTRSPGYFPVCMTFAQGIDDYTWGTRFNEAGFGCESNNEPVNALSGSGTARTAITVQEANASSSYLEFFTRADETEPSGFESFPYDFSLEPPLHYLDLAIREVKKVSATGVIRATATLANGLPAPDGLPFNLAVTWNGGGSASYAGVSSGGVVAFQLALPETAYGEQATFVATHPADGSYLEVSSRLRANVKKPKAPPPSPCTLAERRERSLTRQYRRLRRHAGRASGSTRRVLRRRAARVKRKLRTAKAKADNACASRPASLWDGSLREWSASFPR